VHQIIIWSVQHTSTISVRVITPLHRKSFMPLRTSLSIQGEATTTPFLFLSLSLFFDLDGKHPKMNWRPSQQSWKQRFQQPFHLRVSTKDTLTFHQSPFTSKTCQDPGDTGCTLWDASLVLAHLLLNKPELIQEKRVVELGSGIGLLGVLVAYLGARHTTLSDLDSTLGILQRNIDENRHLLGNRDIQAIPIHWGDEQHTKSLPKNTEVNIYSILFLFHPRFFCLGGDMFRLGVSMGNCSTSHKDTL